MARNETFGIKCGVKWRGTREK